MADHVFHDAETQEMRCSRCGFTAKLKMPDTIENLIVQMDAFTKLHENCEKVPAEAKMSDYIQGFDNGCDYILFEIKRWAVEHNKDVSDLIDHLEMETK